MNSWRFTRGNRSSQQVEPTTSPNLLRRTTGVRGRRDLRVRPGIATGGGAKTACFQIGTDVSTTFASRVKPAGSGRSFRSLRTTRSDRPRSAFRSGRRGMSGHLLTFRVETIAENFFDKYFSTNVRGVALWLP